VTHYVRHGPAPFADLEPIGTAGLKGWASSYRSATAFPRAWVVQQSAVVKDLEALTTLREHPEVLRTKVLLGEGEALSGPPCESSVRIDERAPGSLTFQTDACAPGYLVIADSFFPGWVATIDGQPARILRGDFLLDAVQVPRGPSVVRLEYRPLSFRLGAAVTLVGLFALIAVLAPRTRLRRGQ
jgi:hypothetical protein